VKMPQNNWTFPVGVLLFAFWLERGFFHIDWLRISLWWWIVNEGTKERGFLLSWLWYSSCM
jgi:hypothetical protein